MKYVNPYNTVEFYVGDITEPQTIKIYTDLKTSVDIEVSEGNKWYTYVLPKDKGMCMIEGDSVKNVVVKSNISYEPRFQPPFTYGKIIPSSTIEASFKGSNTNNVTHMNGMFYGCSCLTSLDLSGFDTSNVTSMTAMFYYCINLKSLDLRNFNTSNVIYMNGMFYGCSGLASLNLRNFNTSNVTLMNGMFSNCRSLTSLDLSGWDTSKVNYMDGMFTNCDSLRTIKMVGCLEPTITKIQEQLTKDNITRVTIVTE